MNIQLTSGFQRGERRSTFTAMDRGIEIAVVPALFGSFDSPAGGWVVGHFARAVAIDGAALGEVRRAAASFTMVSQLRDHRVGGKSVSASAWADALKEAALA